LIGDPFATFAEGPNCAQYRKKLDGTGPQTREQIDFTKSARCIGGVLEPLVEEYFHEIVTFNKKEVAQNVILLFLYDTLRASQGFAKVGRSPTLNYDRESEPPRLAEFLVGVFAKKRYRVAILSDLGEDFDRDITAGMSISRARWRYRAAALRSIGPQAYAALKRLGFVGLVFEAARRWIG
jgi:hypothetical protein